MSPPPPLQEHAAPLDRDAGREDDAAALGRRLPLAPPDYLDGALANPALGPDELEFVLRNRNATAAILAKISRNKSWMRPRRAKFALVSHPKSPLIAARTFLPHLFWRQLAEVSADLRLSPVLRRDAEKILRNRLPELSLGERVTLARLAGRGLIDALSSGADGQVLRALAGNTRATEGDVARIVGRPDAPASFLAWLADESVWGQRRALRLALVRHKRTPAATALRLTERLSRRDLEDLRRDPLAPRLVRVAAERRLDGPPAARRPDLG